MISGPIFVGRELCDRCGTIHSPGHDLCPKPKAKAIDTGLPAATKSRSSSSSISPSPSEGMKAGHRPVLSDYLDDLEHEIRNDGDVILLRAKIVAFVHVNLGVVKAERDEAISRIAAARREGIEALRELADAAGKDLELNQEEDGGWWSSRTLKAVTDARAIVAAYDARDILTKKEGETP